ncbi:MAG: thioredoxin family protein [Casimicrobiaceae bacterium]
MIASGTAAATLPYSAAADAWAAVRDAQQRAAQTHRLVLLVFGANWCEDCRALDKAFHAGDTAALLAREFEVVKIDVGDFDRNLDVAQAYGDPVAKGIPAAVILSASDRILYTTRAGELADARRMTRAGVHDFFISAAKAARQAR